MAWRVNRLEDLPPGIRAKAGSQRGPRGRSPEGVSGNGVGSWRCNQCGQLFEQVTWRTAEKHCDQTGHNRMECVL